IEYVPSAPVGADPYNFWYGSIARAQAPSSGVPVGLSKIVPLIVPPDATTCAGAGDAASTGARHATRQSAASMLPRDVPIRPMSVLLRMRMTAAGRPDGHGPAYSCPFERLRSPRPPHGG